MTLTPIITLAALAATLLAGWLAAENAPTTDPIHARLPPPPDDEHLEQWETRLAHAVDPREPPIHSLPPILRLYKTIDATRRVSLDEHRLPALTHLLDGEHPEAYIERSTREAMPGPPWLANTPLYHLWRLTQPILRSSRRRRLAFFEALARDLETLEETL